MYMVTQRIACCLVLLGGLIACQPEEYVPPEREDLTLEALEIASKIAPPSSNHDVYDVDFTGFAQRYLNVTMSIECPTPCEIKMATWTPGSYLIREYARNISRLMVQTTEGKELGVTKVNKNTWTVDTDGPRKI